MPIKRHAISTGDPVHWTWLGRVGYLEAMALMENLRDAVEKSDIRGMLLFLEHPRVITIGKRANFDDIIADEAELAKRGFRVFSTDRGGMATCHGPGQLICYMVINLRVLGVGVRAFVLGIEQTIRNVLGSMGVEATRVDGMPGVWVHGKKIAALGMRVKNHVTSHGFALNVSYDLKAYDLIVPCGMIEMKATNLAEHLKSVPVLSHLAQVLAEMFGHVFGVEMIKSEKTFTKTTEPTNIIESDAAARRKGEAA